MKRAEKREKMIEIFSPYMNGSLVRELIDKCLDLDGYDPDLVEEIQKGMLEWYTFDLTNEQVIELIEEHNENHKIESFDTYERENLAYYLADKITGMEWPMNGDSSDYKKKFYSTLKENAPKLGYKFNGII